MRVLVIGFGVSLFVASVVFAGSVEGDLPSALCGERTAIAKSRIDDVREDTGAWEVRDGGFSLRRVDDARGFLLEVGVLQAPAIYGRIEALKIYAMPSRTFLAALVVDDLDPRVFLAVWGVFEGFPLATSTMRFDGSRIRIGIDAPPRGDRSILVDYVVHNKGEYRTKTVALAHFANLDRFDLVANPVVVDGRGTGYRFCGSCGGQFCGCINCPSIEYTLCCPSCEQHCGYVFCP